LLYPSNATVHGDDAYHVLKPIAGSRKEFSASLMEKQDWTASEKCWILQVARFLKASMF
jgi:hypothetical protein